MAASAPLTVIGAISGTSMDGIDVAVIETDGRDYVRPLAGRTYPYPDALRRRLLAFLQDPSLAERDPLTELDAAVTDAFGDVLAQFLREEPSAAGTALIGLHGQTVYHRPERRFTRQLGSGELMARRLGIKVVDGFRLADVASGGHGAPFAPLYHAALARKLAQPLMLLNLGGVGNVTYIEGDTLVAFDTGPASALIDDFVHRRFGVPYDEGGKLARQGRVDDGVLKQLMANPFFAEKAPKSLDRNHFHAWARIVESLPDHDAVATLAAFTVESVAASLAHVPGRPLRWLVTGGGRHNQVFMDRLRDRLGVAVEPVEAEGWNGDLLEAQCFAYLAMRAVQGLPLSLPSTTGVPQPMPGGRIWPPA
jgi:anhydro-N-acetylmuramic acid kinase